jgi:molybdopterin-guanine dinucleotide biosynthesis protein A
MGEPKALVPFRGTPLGTRAADLLHACGAAPVVLQGAAGDVAAALGLPVLADEHPGAGPLAAFATAVGWCATVDRDLVVVTACDQPLVSVDTVRALVSGLASAQGGETGPQDAVVAAPVTVDGRTHPFPTVWSVHAARALAALVEAGERRADAGFSLGVVGVPVPAEELVDMDSPDDLRRHEPVHDDVDPARPDGPTP